MHIGIEEGCVYFSTGRTSGLTTAMSMALRLLAEMGEGRLLAPWMLKIVCFAAVALLAELIT